MAVQYYCFSTALSQSPGSFFSDCYKEASDLVNVVVKGRTEKENFTLNIGERINEKQINDVGASLLRYTRIEQGSFGTRCNR
jgi:hypothetical protein